MRILVVEDEPEMSRLLAAALVAAGYTVDRAATCADAEEAVWAAPCALALVDRRLPDGDGAGLVARLRRMRPGLPVILVSALDAVSDRVDGLDAGADDYLTKPFDRAELLARVRAALRRPGGAPAPPILCGRVRFDPSRREVSIDDTPLVLRRRELAILEALLLRAGRVVTRDAITDAVFGQDDEVQPNTLDSHVSRLRTRLAAAGGEVAIHPVRGLGWLLVAA